MTAAPFERARHGGDVFAAARELGRPYRELLDFSANINPLGPPPGLKKHLFEAFDLTAHYPDPFAASWRSRLARKHGLSPDRIVAGNGSTALMYLAARVFRFRRPVVIQPAFAEYEESLRHAGSRPVRVFCRAEDDWDVTIHVAERALAEQPDALYLANPTSPAGRLIDPDVLNWLLDRTREKDVHLIVDEAFLDFTSAPSLMPRTRDHPRLIVIRALTKIYALPGLRLGYLAAPEPIAGRLLAQAEPWSVNALALAAGLYCLDQEAYDRRTRALVDRERTWLARKLESLGLGRVIPSRVNYLLVRLAEGMSEEAVVHGLRRRGVLVRPCSSFPGLAGHIRLAVRSPKENRALAAILAQALPELHDDDTSEEADVRHTLQGDAGPVRG
jgi:threonine-phosphate decarboxylase